MRRRTPRFVALLLIVHLWCSLTPSAQQPFNRYELLPLHGSKIIKNLLHKFKKKLQLCSLCHLLLTLILCYLLIPLVMKLIQCSLCISTLMWLVWGHVALVTTILKSWLVEDHVLYDSSYSILIARLQKKMPFNLLPLFKCSNMQIYGAIKLWWQRTCLTLFQLTLLIFVIAANIFKDYPAVPFCFWATIQLRFLKLF